MEQRDISLWSDIRHLPATISGDTVKRREKQAQFCIDPNSTPEKFCSIQILHYVSEEDITRTSCSSLYCNLSPKGQQMSGFLSKIIYPYDLTSMQGALHGHLNVYHA